MFLWMITELSAFYYRINSDKGMRAGIVFTQSVATVLFCCKTYLELCRYVWYAARAFLYVLRFCRVNRELSLRVVREPPHTIC